MSSKKYTVQEAWDVCYKKINAYFTFYNGHRTVKGRFDELSRRYTFKVTDEETYTFAASNPTMFHLVTTLPLNYTGEDEVLNVQAK